MISNTSTPGSARTAIGIHAIASYQPDWRLTNDWFDSIPRKFVQHTGIEERLIARETEVQLAVRAIENLIDQTGCELGKCAALVFTSPSFVPPSVLRKYAVLNSAAEEEIGNAVGLIVDAMPIEPRRVLAVNNFCAGYATALTVVRNILLPSLDLKADEFVLVVTASRISRITDYSCRQTAPLFGDLSTVTLLSRTDSDRYPVHFELLAAEVEKRTTSRPFFDFSLRHKIPLPTEDGGTSIADQRIVFSLDGMGIADTAPRAMAESAATMANEIGWNAEEIEFIVPHQAGSGIVRLAEMKLRQAGFKADVINGMTMDVGNISSGSVPFTLQQKWNELQGDILCPIASVGPPVVRLSHRDVSHFGRHPITSVEISTTRRLPLVADGNLSQSLPSAAFV